MDKDKEQLIDELAQLRQRIAELEASGAEGNKVEEKYRLLIDNAAEAIAVIQDGKIKLANPKLTEITGYNIEELTSIPFAERVHPDDRDMVIDYRNRRLKGESAPGTYALKIIDKAGNIKWLERKVTLINWDGKPASLVFDTDITERKRAEEALQASEAGYRALLDNANEVIVVVQDNMSKFSNRKAVEITGYSQKELTSRPFIDFVHPDDRQMAAENYLRGLKGEKRIRELPIRILVKDGNIRWMEFSWAEFAWEGRQALLYLVTDVTERREMEETLKQSEAKYRELAESITDVFFALDKKLRYTYWNKASEELTGITAKDALGKHIYDIFPDTEAMTRVVSIYHRALATKEPQHFVDESSIGGRDCVFDISAYPAQDGLCVYVKDITERRKLEVALAESEQWYRHLFDNAPFGIGFASIDGKVITLNKVMETITGYSAEEFGKINLADIYLNKADREVLLQEVRRHGSVIDYPVQLRRKDGTHCDVLLSVRLTTIGDREFLQTICHDVTERKQADEKLRESEERYRFLVELSPEAIFVASEGKHVFVNSAGLKLFGASSPDQVIGKPVMDIIHPDYRKIVAERMGKSMETGMIAPAIEEKFIRLDGTEVDVEVRAAPLVYQGKPAMQAVVRDISERKQAEETLRLSEENFRDSIENSPLGIRIVSEDGNTLYANRALLAIYGYSSLEELTTIPTKQRYTPESYAEHRRRVKKRNLGEYVPQNYEIGIVRKDGQVRYLAVSRGAVIWNGERQFQVVYQDITERKQAEEEYQTIIRTAIDGFCIMNIRGQFLDVNEAYCQMIGYSRDELLNMKISDIEAIETSTETAKHIRKIKEIGHDRFETCSRCKDGEIIDVEVSVNYLPTEGGRLVIFERDITQRKRAESEMRMKDYAMASSISGILILDLDGMIIYTNQAYLDMWAYQNGEQATGRKITETAADKESAGMLLAAVRNKGYWKGEFLVTRRDGRTIGILLSASLVRDEKNVPIAIIASVIDVTERKQAEEQLQQERDRAQQYLDIAGVMLVANDADGRVSLINDKGCQILGYEQEEIIGKDWFDTLIPESVRREVKAVFKKLMSGEVEPVEYFENPVLTKNGEERIIAWHNVILKDAVGKIVGTLSSGEDITERRQTEDALLASEGRYRLLAENVRDVILAMDMDLRFTYVSPSVKYLGDRTAEEVMSVSLEQLLTPASLQLAVKTFAEEMAMADVTAQDPNRSRTLEVEILRRDGSTIWAELKMNFMRDPFGHPVGILGVMRDISERKKAEGERKEMEQKALLASHLASVGELSAGIAHEINNPLTGVIGYAELLLQEDISEHMRNDLEIIHEGAERVADIVKGLLTFARQTKPERTVVDINRVIQVALRLRAYELETSNIRVTTRLAHDLPVTVADAGQLQQVFLNLIINAEMEMRSARGKGKLIISSERLDNTIRISFKDDGPGITEGNLERIFDPFFTTRETGKGTGLGLSICHGIVTEHKGRIYVESQPGKGATFIVELPIIAEKRHPKQAKPARRQKRVTGARILVVDDEPVVRRLLSQILTEDGHKVEVTDDGKDALDRIKSNRYSLILLDMKLPGTSGSQLYGRIKKISDSLAKRVVFITGDVMGTDTEAFFARTGAPYITKPFDVKQLSAEIKRLLATRRSKPTHQVKNQKPKVKK